MPKEQSANEMLIQKLMQPRDTRASDIVQALSPLASKDMQESIRATAKSLGGDLSKEERRLSKAAVLENLKNKSKVDPFKQKTQDYNAIERMGGIISGNNARKGKLISNGRSKVKTGKLMMDMVKDFENGRLTFDNPSNTQYAAAFAKLMDTASGVEIIKQFKYDSAYSAVQDMKAYLSGDPRTTVTDEQFKEIKIMSASMVKNEQEVINKSVARELNNYIPRLARNPEIFERFRQQYQDEAGEVEFDENLGRFVPVLTTDVSVLHGGQSIQPDASLKKSTKQTITVSNGTETFDIPVEDEAEASAEGFRRVD